MLSIITCTSGRPIAFSHLEQWVAAQDYKQPFQWIVSTSDDTGYTFSMRQKVIRNKPKKGQSDLLNNLRNALHVVDGDRVVIMEDDDYYAPSYLSQIDSSLSSYSLVGFSPARYYNVASRHYRLFENKQHASLAQTAFTRDVFRFVLDLCNRDFLDVSLWREFRGPRLILNHPLHIGIKGMPGRPGLGIGHRPMMGKDDSDLAIFREWGIPDVYLQYHHPNLIAPLCAKGQRKAWLGSLPRKPWDYPVTVAIPTIGDIESLYWAMETLRAGTLPPYFLIIDTGSSDREAVESLRSHDCEVHFIASHGWRHPSEPVTAALDLAFSLCKTDLLYLTHSDCFAMRRNLLEWYAGQCNAAAPAVGYRMSERHWITDDWEWMMGHASAMVYMPVIHKMGITWSMGRYLAVNGAPLHKASGWVDTESSFNYRLRDVGIMPVLIYGDRQNYRRNTDSNIDHVRTYSGSKLYRVSDSVHRKESDEWMADAIAKAKERVEMWSNVSGS